MTDDHDVIPIVVTQGVEDLREFYTENSLDLFKFEVKSEQLTFSFTITLQKV